MNIGFIGSGQMAQALAAGISTSRAELGQATHFFISDPNQEAVEAFKQRVDKSAKTTQSENNLAVIADSSIVIVAVKPQYIDSALSGTESAFESDVSKILVSVAAGVTIHELKRFTCAERIVRAMPNTPCLIGRGAIGYAANDGLSVDENRQVLELLSSVGIVHEVSEENIDAVTGLSGSGPAYVFTFIESLADGGVLNGLPRATALSLALETVIGAAELVRQTGEHTSVLKDRVTSPGGTTIAGLKALEETGFRDSVISAVSSATERSIELGG